MKVSSGTRNADLSLILHKHRKQDVKTINEAEILLL